MNPKNGFTVLISGVRGKSFFIRAIYNKTSISRGGLCKTKERYLLGITLYQKNSPIALVHISGSLLEL